MDTSFFTKLIEFFFWAIAAGGFLYGVQNGRLLAKSIKNKNSVDQDEATDGIAVAIILVVIGIGGGAFFPAIPSF